MSINTSLSGIMAAQTQMAVSANNIANARSTLSSDSRTGQIIEKPYQALQVQQISLAEGGVRAVVLPAKPATLPVFDPSSLQANEEGIVEMPNVSPETEAINQVTARAAFEANIKALQKQMEMQDSLLNIVS